MPGMYGIVEAAPPSNTVGAAMKGMRDALAHESWFACIAHVENDDGIGLGSVSLGYAPARSKLAWDAGSSCGAVLHGELYETEVLLAALRRAGIAVAADDHAAILLAGYLHGEKDFLGRLHGSFSAAIWNGLQRQLVLISDRFGSKPLYYRRVQSGLQFASGLTALLATDAGPRRVNPRGLAQFFTFGHYQRSDTSLEGVRVLPAAAHFTFRPDTATLSEDSYGSLAEAEVEQGITGSEWLSRIDGALAKAVERRTAGAPGLGISLSGGLDARTILGLIDSSRTPLKTLCLGVPGSLDLRSSAELARLAGCPFEPFLLNDGFLKHFRQHLDHMVALTDGQYLSQCIVIPTLPIYREMGIQTLLRGHAGELMHMRKAYNYSLDRVALEIHTDAQLRKWLFRRLRAFMLEGVTGQLFMPEFQDGLGDLAAQSLEEDLADVAHIESPLKRIWHLFVTQRLRRETVLSMAKFGSVVEPRLPYLDNDLVPLLLAAPVELKLGEDIQTYILGKRRPQFLRVANANTGARVGAAPWLRQIATLQMKILAKTGVPGYQPYERLGLWLRRDLAPMVREILLDTQTLDRGVYCADGIRAVVRRHLEFGKNHTYLLMALMIFELGLRRLIDASPAAARSSSKERHRAADVSPALSIR